MAKKKKAASAKRASRSSRNKSGLSDTEREIAALQARIDRLKGETLTQDEISDIDWLQKSERSESIQAWIAAVPKGEYCKLAGRQHKLIDDAARNYGFPLGESIIDLRAAIKSLHDFIAENAHKLRGDLQRGKVELEEEKLRRQIVGLELDNDDKRIKLQYTKGRAVPKEVVSEALIWLSGRLQNLGGTLARIHPEARDALNEMLEALSEELESGQLNF